ncbi:MAG: T9SS type A sorting domain-containing protein, partial [Bacteroidota bacterium]
QENYLRTYPNPFSDKLCIEFYSVDSQNVTIELYDIAGHLILKKKVPVKLTSFNQIILDELGSLGQGTYIIRLTSKKETYQDQIIRM